MEASKHPELIHSKKPVLGGGGKINLFIAFSKHFKQLAKFNLFSDSYSPVLPTCVLYFFTAIGHITLNLHLIYLKMGF